MKYVNKERNEAGSTQQVVADFVMDGAQLVDAVRNAERPYDLILTDQEMPNKNGDEALREITSCFDAGEVTWRCPLVAVTGHGDCDEVIDMMFNAGATRVLPKPVSRYSFRAELKKHGLL